HEWIEHPTLEDILEIEGWTAQFIKNGAYA
ncbi:uncharacterized protein METZ01_LOCUS430985, partial [marine metagenome]